MSVGIEMVRGFFDAQSSPRKSPPLFNCRVTKALDWVVVAGVPPPVWIEQRDRVLALVRRARKTYWRSFKRWGWYRWRLGFSGGTVDNYRESEFPIFMFFSYSLLHRLVMASGSVVMIVVMFMKPSPMAGKKVLWYMVRRFHLVIL